MTDPRKIIAQKRLDSLKVALDALPLAGADGHAHTQGAWHRLSAALAATEPVEPGEPAVIVRPGSGGDTYQHIVHEGENHAEH